MEVLREDMHGIKSRNGQDRFNPCFNGSVERGQPFSSTHVTFFCFNPCFNGSVERGTTARDQTRGVSEVSILVLMEVLREEKKGPHLRARPRSVSILVLMEVLREVKNFPELLMPKMRFQSLF